MPLIFSYGSLHKEAVQLSVYGRVLRGDRDALVGWMRDTDPFAILRLNARPAKAS